MLKQLLSFIIPSRQAEISTHMPRYDVLKTVEDNLGFGNLGDDDEKQFHGTVDENSFSIRPNTRSYLAPQIDGRVEHAAGISTVFLNVRMVKKVRILYTAILFLVTLSTLMDISLLTLAFSQENLRHLLTILIGGVFYVTVMQLYFRSYAKKAIKTLTALLTA